MKKKEIHQKVSKKKKTHKQKKHKRESINIRRRNMERTTAKMHLRKKKTNSNKQGEQT